MATLEKNGIVSKNEMWFYLLWLWLGVHCCRLTLTAHGEWNAFHRHRIRNHMHSPFVAIFFSTSLFCCNINVFPPYFKLLTVTDIIKFVVFLVPTLNLPVYITLPFYRTIFPTIAVVLLFFLLMLYVFVCSTLSNLSFESGGCVRAYNARKKQQLNSKDNSENRLTRYKMSLSNLAAGAGSTHRKTMYEFTYTWPPMPPVCNWCNEWKRWFQWNIIRVHITL